MKHINNFTVYKIHSFASLVVAKIVWLKKYLDFFEVSNLDNKFLVLRIICLFTGYQVYEWAFNDFADFLFKWWCLYKRSNFHPLGTLFLIKINFKAFCKIEFLFCDSLSPVHEALQKSLSFQSIECLLTSVIQCELTFLENFGFEGGNFGIANSEHALQLFFLSP